jgi:hypothetical protein
MSLAELAVESFAPSFDIAVPQYMIFQPLAAGQSVDAGGDW